MALLRIEYFDGLDWRVRGEGETDATADRVAAELLAYPPRYRHRAFLDGVLVAETVRKTERSKLRLVRR
jgi:hypothetical protein